MSNIREGIKAASDSDLFGLLCAVRDSTDATDIEFRKEVVAEMKLRKPAARGAAANIQLTNAVCKKTNQRKRYYMVQTAGEIPNNTNLQRCIEIRDELQFAEKTVRKMMSDPDFNPEMKANAMLAVRHIEDARMRLGKVLQHAGDGVSIYDKNKQF